MMLDVAAMCVDDERMTHHRSPEHWPTDDGGALALLRALADSTRLKILCVLAGSASPLAVKAIVERLGLAQSTASYHLRRLRDVGLIDSTSHGASELFRLDPTGPRQLERPLGELVFGRPDARDSGGEVGADTALAARIAAHLAPEFRGTFGDATIARHVRESLGALRDGHAPDFLPSLVMRFSRERLRALAQAEGTVSKDRPELLFVCVRNAGRSQMAAGLARHLSGGRVGVRSAGSRPIVGVDPVVAGAMWERGIDLGEQFPKPLTDEVVRAADVVVTMGCGDACPIYPATRYEDWPVEDPVGLPIERVRLIRDELQHRVGGLLRELGVRLVA